MEHPWFLSHKAGFTRTVKPTVGCRCQVRTETCRGQLFYASAHASSSLTVGFYCSREARLEVQNNCHPRRKLRLQSFGTTRVLQLVDFHTRGATVNTASYCATLDRLLRHFAGSDRHCPQKVSYLAYLRILHRRE
ncbi:hypothetical protein AVEN_250851-1 [Araneus ventricosus]|uniref:Uncharacterized protein n=1 Tax=Araneus ventricosus TaxID=182803 RepID=A0A4Y2SC94_ARAVE|nr:hypothetical protein AVEN_250851-1 [Araneus ventricosus]